MKITTDKEAQEAVGSQAYIFSDKSLTPTVITNIKLNKTFSGMGEPQVEATIVTSIGEFKSEDVFISRESLIEYVDKIIGREQ
jgi:hypothetical protein